MTAQELLTILRDVPHDTRLAIAPLDEKNEREISTVCYDERTQTLRLFSGSPGFLQSLHTDLVRRKDTYNDRAKSAATHCDSCRPNGIRHCDACSCHQPGTGWNSVAPLRLPPGTQVKVRTIAFDGQPSKITRLEVTSHTNTFLYGRQLDTDGGYSGFYDKDDVLVLPSHLIDNTIIKTVEIGRYVTNKKHGTTRWVIDSIVQGVDLLAPSSIANNKNTERQSS